MKLADLQQTFLDDLTGTNQGLLDGLVLDDGNVGLATRLSIYRNAYHTRLREALATDHEMLQRYVGDDAFAEMSQGFVTSQPSKEFSLRHLGEGLPGFLENHERYSQLPVLAQLAKFERLLLKAFDAADSLQLVSADLAQVSAQQWPSLVLRLHPGVHINTLRFGAVEIWQALKNEQVPPAALSDEAVWLIFRNRQRLTEFRSLPVDESVVLQMGGKGLPFSDLCAQLLSWHDAAEAAPRAAQFIQRWVADGLVTEFAQAKD